MTDDSATSSPPSASPSPERDIYEQAFDQVFGSDGPAQDPPTAPPDGAATHEASPRAADRAEQPSAQPTLSDDDRHILSRNHLSPDMVAGWSGEQIRAFVQNARKREADQQAEYARLKEQASKSDRSDDRPADSGGDSAQPADDPFEDARQALDSVVEAFGEEARPITQAFEALHAQVSNLRGTLDAVAKQSPIVQNTVGSMLIRQAVGSLESEYPSLSKPEAKQRVIERFKTTYPSMRFRDDEDLVDRIERTMREATAAEFGPALTESAASAALLAQTRERLSAQPDPGHARGQSRPLTQDEVYDQAAARIFGTV